MHKRPVGRGAGPASLHDDIRNYQVVRGAGHRIEGHGRLIFASVLLMVLGLFNLLDGIAAVARSHVFIANAHYLIGDLRIWGWVALIFAALQVLAGVRVLTGNQFPRWFGVAVVALNSFRPVLLHSGLPVLVADHHRGGHGRVVRTVRIR